MFRIYGQHQSNQKVHHKRIVTFTNLQIIRDFQRNGANLTEDTRILTYYLTNLSKQLHDNETHTGLRGSVSSAPL